MKEYPELSSQLRYRLALPTSVSQASDRDMSWLTSPLDLQRNMQFREALKGRDSLHWGALSNSGQASPGHAGGIPNRAPRDETRSTW